MTYAVSAFSDDLSSDFAEAAALAAACDLDAVAVRYVQGRLVTELDASEVRNIKQVADAHGLAISVVASQYGRGFYLDDDEAQERAERHLASAIRCAEILETPLIRVFTLWLPGQDDPAEWGRRPDGSDWVGRVAERLDASLEMARRSGTKLMLELEGASYVGRVHEARQLIDHLGSAEVTLCWDVVNGWWSGELPWPDGWRHAQSLPIVDVQTKDVLADAADPSRAGLERTVFSRGDVPYPQIIAALLNAGYDGYFTVERVYHPQKPEQHPQLQADALADARNLRNMVDGIARTIGGWDG